MYYQEVVKPRTSDFDKDKKLSYEAILHILENVGGHHSEAVNDSIVPDDSFKSTWIIISWRIQIIRRIIGAETLNVKTWVFGKVPSIVTYRGFIVTDKDGNELIRAQADLCLVDIKTGKLLKVGNDFSAQYIPEDEAVFSDTLPRLRRKKQYSYKCEIILRRCDEDFNHHIHNTRYIEYALDMLPNNIYKTANFHSVRITYTKALKLTDHAYGEYIFEDNKHSIAISTDTDTCTLIEFI